ncbi:hypothetical protein SUGI_0878270 [Cryptomeria japonica]|nr:hypothetical protein SUGI_0878270 [Cryptomeria japonica]
MHLFDWKLGFNPRIELVLETSVWFCVYNLPSEFWGDEILKIIGRKLGKFLYLDNPLEDHTMGTYFRICVSVSLKVKIPSEIELMSDIGNLTQLIDREDKLDLNLQCKSLSHTPDSCDFKVSIDAQHKIEQSFLEKVIQEIGNLETVDADPKKSSANPSEDMEDTHIFVESSTQIVGSGEIALEKAEFVQEETGLPHDDLIGIEVPSLSEISLPN